MPFRSFALALLCAAMLWPATPRADHSTLLCRSGKWSIAVEPNGVRKETIMSGTENRTVVVGLTHATDEPPSDIVVEFFREGGEREERSLLHSSSVIGLAARIDVTVVGGSGRRGSKVQGCYGLPKE